MGNATEATNDRITDQTKPVLQVFGQSKQNCLELALSTVGGSLEYLTFLEKRALTCRGVRDAFPHKIPGHLRTSTRFLR